MIVDTAMLVSRPISGSLLLILPQCAASSTTFADGEYTLPKSMAHEVISYLLWLTYGPDIAKLRGVRTARTTCGNCVRCSLAEVAIARFR